MGTALGSIDGRFRPLLRIDLPDDRGSFLALLDTGFNGALHGDRNFALMHGVVPRGEPVSTKLAGGTVQLAQLGFLDIIWFDRKRRVDVLIAIGEAPRTAARDGEPEALIGGALLAPSLVLLDDQAMTVEIEAQGDR